MITATDWWRFSTLRCIVINIPINVCEDQIQGVTSSSRKTYQLSQWDNICKLVCVEVIKIPVYDKFSVRESGREAASCANHMVYGVFTDSFWQRRWMGIHKHK